LLELNPVYVFVNGVNSKCEFMKVSQF